MNKNIEDKHKVIINIGKNGGIMSLNVNEISDYHILADELLLHPLPAGKENRYNFIKGLILLENKLNLGSTSQVWKFMKRLDLYSDTELMDWIFINRNNPYVPFGSFHPPLEVRSYSQYLEYDRKRQEHREKMISLDMEKSRIAKEKKTRIIEKHTKRKKINDEKRRRGGKVY